MMPTGQTLLVTGASGQLGRRVVALLLEAGETQIIATTRTPDKLADLAERGVDVRYANFDEPASLTAAFAGADRLLLISTDTIGARQDQHVAAINAAASVGVKHIIYTSLLSANDTPVTLAADHVVTEEALASSAMGYTILRNSIYAEILLGALEQARSLDGKLFSAAGDGKVSYITREDCAWAASAALASSFEGRRTLDITGPEALSQADIAQMATELGPQPITYVPLTVEVLVENMVKAGLPQALAEAYASFDVATAQGKHSVVSTTVEDLTGRKPMRVADFLAEHVQAVS